jgi:hypothetical protein
VSGGAVSHFRFTSFFGTSRLPQLRTRRLYRQILLLTTVTNVTSDGRRYCALARLSSWNAAITAEPVSLALVIAPNAADVHPATVRLLAIAAAYSARSETAPRRKSPMLSVAPVSWTNLKRWKRSVTLHRNGIYIPFTIVVNWFVLTCATSGNHRQALRNWRCRLSSYYDPHMFPPLAMWIREFRIDCKKRR